MKKQEARSKKLAFGTENVTVVVHTTHGINLCGIKWEVAWVWGQGPSNKFFEVDKKPLIKDRDGLWDAVIARAEEMDIDTVHEGWALVGVCVPILSGFESGRVLWADNYWTPEQALQKVQDGELTADEAMAFMSN